MDFVFMDSKIDFSTYTLDELYSSARELSIAQPTQIEQKK